MKSTRILICDNNKTEGLLMKSTIQRISHTEVVLYDSGEVLIEKLESVLQVIILEFDMPGYQGLDLVRAIRGKSEDALIVIVTSETDPSVITELQAMRIFNYIIKSESTLEYLQWVIQKSLEIINPGKKFTVNV
ncbi:MAG: response regulator [Bacteroidota bacterium]